MEEPFAAPIAGHPKYPDQTEGEVASCRVRLQLASRSAPWHEELSGTLFLQGGGIARTFAIHVWMETYPDQVAQGQELLPERSWEQVHVSHHEQVRTCFALRLPGSVPFGRLRLCARVRTDWRHSLTLFAEIHVAPPVPFQRMADLLEALTGVAVRTWRTFELGDGVAAEFVPEKEGPKPFDAAQLELFRNNGMIYGTLTVDPLDRTFADRLRSAAGVHRVSFPYRFPEADLSGVHGFFEQSLRTCSEDLGQLPIPAARPQRSAIELPLPAEAQPGEDQTTGFTDPSSG